MRLGAAAYGPYGPPFADPALQAAYEREAKKLASSSVLITEGTARDLLTAVVNSALAAGKAMTPEIETKAKTAAGASAHNAVAALLLGTLAFGLFGVTVWGIVGFTRVNR